MWKLGQELLKKVAGAPSETALAAPQESGLVGGLKIHQKKYEGQTHLTLDEKNPKYAEVKAVVEAKLKTHEGDPIILSLITALSLYDEGSIGIQHMNGDGLTFLNKDEVQGLADPQHDLAIGTGILIRLDEKNAVASVAEIDTFSMVDISKDLTGIEQVNLQELSTRKDLDPMITNKNTGALQSERTPIVEIEELLDQGDTTRVRIGIHEFVLSKSESTTLKVHDKLVIHVKDPKAEFIQNPGNVDGIYKVGTTIVKRDGENAKPTQPQLL